LVDDEPVIREALRRYFQRQGWTVDEASDGGAALACLVPEGAATPPVMYDVIVADLRMPGVSGMELHERLARERPELLPHLILSTGDSVSPDAASFLARAGCPILHKPFALAQLGALVAQVTGR
jgi:DNA-binding response OmpR family regulator